ncbi:UDP-N-acetylglucosamine 2-epimerase [Hydrogenimonas sp. SS33]|uniref:UDP-N-acetylglucosamine 2-epimerase n=1 Tax=Hydrogenimonas leucolamina TaxID=2954236 RepID=UPI00336BCC73
MKRKICVVTGTRAEYGLFYPILKKIQKSEKLQLQLVVTTMHLAPQFGYTLRQIEEDGFKIDETVENLLCADTKSSVAKSTGMATLLLSDVYRRLQPDSVLLLGDRYETLAAATSALLMNIPIAHIHGGEITEGAVDEQIRHAITKMSHLHFTATETFRQRLIRMGENPAKVFTVGAPGLDNILSLPLPSKEELEESLQWHFGEKTVLFTYHPVTLSSVDTSKEIHDILLALERTGYSVLFTYANADEGGHIINEAIEKFCHMNPEKYKVVKNLGQKRYLAAMKYADILVGNTSSGIIEAASFKKPVVNIGDRQRGRLRNDNTIDCKPHEVEQAVTKALSADFLKKCATSTNVYGDGHASERIVEILEKADLSTVKSFYEPEYRL